MRRCDRLSHRLSTARAWSVAVGVLVVTTACDRSDKPLAIYDDTRVGPDAILAELDFLLDDGESFESLGLTPEGFLEQYVRFQLLLEEAKRSFRGLSPAEQARFSVYQESLVRDALVDELFADIPPPDEARMRAVYEERAEEEREFSYVRCRSRELAETVHGWITSGTELEEALARARREYPDRVEGGSLGFNREGELPTQWERAAWALPVGGVSEIVESDGHFTFLRLDGRRRTPFELMRPVIERELREEAIEARRRAIDAQLLVDTRFTPDTTTIALVAARFAAHRDSLATRPGSRIGLPPFTPDELERPLFRVMDQPFTVEALLAELAQFDTSTWTPGRERELLLQIARRRALSVGLQQVAASRGIYQRPDVQTRLERKRAEFMMNALLREVWSGAAVTDQELRERLREQGEAVPGEEALRQLREQITREIQNSRLQAFVDEILARHEIALFPERFPELLERFEAERLEGGEAQAPSG